MSLIQRGFQSYDAFHLPDFVKNGNFVLNKDSPQAEGLTRLWPFQDGGGTQLKGLVGLEKDVTFGSQITGADWTPTSFGGLSITGIFTGSTSEIDIGEEIDFENFSIVLWARPTFAYTAANFPAIFGNLDNNGIEGTVINYHTDSGEWRFLAHRTGDLVLLASPTITSDAELGRNEFNLFVAGTTSGDHFFDINGEEMATSSLTGAANNPGRNQFLMANNGFTNPNNGRWGGDMFHAAMFDHRISDSIRDHVWESPWDLYYETGRVSYFFLSSIVFTSTNLALNHSGASDIGGAIGAELTDDTLNNIWDDVASGDADAGDTEFRCTYVKNTHATLSVLNVAVEIDTDPTESNWEIALGAAGKNGTETEVANEDTAPATPVFGTTALDLGTLAAGDFFPIWIKRIVTAGAGAATPDTGKLRILGDDPN